MASNIGMSVPGASNLMPSTDLGAQTPLETEEQRKKRLQALASATRMTPGVSALGNGYGAALGG